MIFSGYDASRFNENSVTFSMADDITRDLVVALQRITYSGDEQTTLLDAPLNLYIDSTDPNIWLPEPAVKAFESAFDLTLDEDSGLYLLSDSHHSTLLDSNAEVSFRLSDVLDGGDTVTITLPYAAFGLRAEYPLVKNSSYYFPLKLAANESQYTLGRTFLQEASVIRLCSMNDGESIYSHFHRYLTADYERGVFNVSQCSWVEGVEEDLVTILSRDTETSSIANPSVNSSDGAENTPGDSGIGVGAIVGIAIGAVGFISLLSVGAVVWLKKRKAASSSPQELDRGGDEDAQTPETVFGKTPGTEHSESVLDTLSRTHGELEGDGSHVYQLHSEPKEGAALRSTEIHELPGA
jgi:hypothetical protein